MPGMRVMTIRAGVRMYPRDKALQPERCSSDRDVLALPSTAYAGGEKLRAWSFKRRGCGCEFWYVLADDVADTDFIEHPEYQR